MWIQTGDKEPIVVMVFDLLGNPLPGKTNIKLKVYRRSDAKYYDWSDDTFKDAGAVVQLLVSLVEVSATYSPGEYNLDKAGHVRGFNTATISNPVVDDVYFFTVVQDSGTDAENLPQVGQLRVGGALDDIVVDEFPVIL